MGELPEIRGGKHTHPIARSPLLQVEVIEFLPAFVP